LSKFILPSAAATTAADDDAQQHRDVGDEALGQSGDQQDRHQHEAMADATQRRVVGVVHRRHRARPLGSSRQAALAEAAGGALGHGGLPASFGSHFALRVDHGGRGGADRVAKDPVDADAHQADADDGDDGAGDHRRKEAQQRLTAGAIRMEMTPAPMMAPKMPGALGPGIGIGHGHHRADGGKGHAHHHRQLDAEPLRAPSDWISVTRPQQNRSAEISMATCSG
jgi:hypothetical protein